MKILRNIFIIAVLFGTLLLTVYVRLSFAASISPQKYKDEKYGVMFDFSKDLFLQVSEPVDEHLLSLSLFPLNYKDIIKPEIAISIFDNPEKLSTETWFNNHQTVNLGGTSNYHILFTNVGKREDFQFQTFKAIAFQEKYSDVMINRIILADGNRIYSVAYTDYGDNYLNSYFLDILKSIKLNTSQLIGSKVKVDFSLFKTDQSSIAAINRLASPSYQTSGFRLPWANGISHLVTQSWNGSTHIGTQDHAYDFGLSEGTEVRAAKSGVVTFVKNGSTICGSVDKKDYANYIVVNHDTGDSTLYLHLFSTDLHVGDIVTQGMPIGLSGKTGWTNTGTGCKAHLHFQNQDPGSWFTQSHEVYFDEYPDTQLQYGQSYTSQNVSVSTPCNQDYVNLTGLNITDQYTQLCHANVQMNISNTTVSGDGVLNVNVSPGGKIILQNGLKVSGLSQAGGFRAYVQ
jgi:murein DD-endopeptidase MepM/ murein hydrolase activator NlpD